MTSNTTRPTDTWAPVIAKVTFLLLTVIICGTLIYVVRDFLHAIILGLLFGGIAMPFHNRILQFVNFLSERREAMLRRPPKAKLKNPEEYEANRLNRCRSIAAILSVILIFFIIVLPLTMLVASIAKQSYTAIPSAKNWIEKELPGKIHEFDEQYKLMERLDSLKPLLNPSFTSSPESADDDTSRVQEETVQSEEVHIDDLAGYLVAFVRKAVNLLAKTMLTLFSKIWVAVFNFFILLFVMYHVFRDGRQITSYLHSIVPLGDTELAHVASRIRLVFRAICISVFGTAIIQGLLGMLIFRIVGIPALFWGTLLGICSIIPVVGTAIVWVPAAAFLLMTGSVGQALLLVIFCGGLISNVDNILRPLLMNKSGNTGMSYMVLFFAILGGLQTFGLVGIIYGPLIAGICSICLLIFSTQFKSRRENALLTENDDA